jgi:transposase-like protein
VAAESTPRPGWEHFSCPSGVNHRRYEALRAYFAGGASIGQVAERFGYTRSAMASLVRDHRAGKLELFTAPGRPGPRSAPAKDRARARAIELRREGLSVYEISARLRSEGTPLNRTGVGQILAEEGFARLVRGTEPEASINPATTGRDTRLPTTKVIDFAELPERTETAMAGLLLTIPDLLALDLPALATAAGYPGTRVVPATSWILALLALKLTGTRRVSHVDDLLHQPAAALFAGLGVLPKKTALTDLLLPPVPRSPAPLPGRPGHQDDRRRARRQRRIDLRPGLSRRHALGQRSRPRKALRANAFTALPVSVDVLRPRQRHSQPGLRQRRPVQGHPEPGSDRVRRPLEGRLRA